MSVIITIYMHIIQYSQATLYNMYIVHTYSTAELDTSKIHIYSVDSFFVITISTLLIYMYQHER